MGLWDQIKLWFWDWEQEALKRAQTLLVHKTINIDLATAHDKTEYAHQGTMLIVQDLTEGAELDCYFEDQNSDLIELDKNRKVYRPFNRFYISNSTQAGKSATLLVGYASMFDVTDPLVPLTKIAVDAVKSSVDTLQTKTDAVKSSVDASITEIQTLQGKTDLVKSSVDNTKTEVQTLQTKTDDVKTEVTTVGTKTDAVKTSVDNTRGAVDLTKTAVDLVKSAVDTTKSAVDSATSEIITLEGKTDLVKSAVDLTKTAVDSAKTEIQTLQTKTDAITGELQNPTVLGKEATLGLIKSATDAVKGSVDTVQTKVDNVKSSVDLVKTATDSVKSSTDTIQTKVDTVKASTDLVKTAVDATTYAVDVTAGKVEQSLNKLDLLKGSTDTIQTKVDAVTGELTTKASEATQSLIKTAVDNVKSSTDLIQTKVDQVKSSTDLVKASTDLIQSKVDWLKYSMLDVPDGVMILPLDEGSGSITNDTSGHENNGVIYGASWVDGKFGKALQFDGVDDYVGCGSGASLDDLTQFTYSCWVFNTQAGVRQYLMQKYSKEIGKLVQDILRGEVTTNGTSPVTVTVETLPVNQWVHVLMTYDDSGDRKIHIFINGSECTYSTQTAGTGTLTSEATQPFELGVHPFDQYYYKGIMDDVRVYSRVLSNDEIKVLYMKGSSAINIVKQGIDDLQSRIDSVEEMVSGFTALSFDGDDDLISIPQSDSLTMDDELTIEIWVNGRELPVTTSFVGRYASNRWLLYCIALQRPSLYVVLTNNNAYSVDIPSPIDLNKWYHIVATFKRNDKLRIFQNGVEMNNTTVPDYPINDDVTHVVAVGFVAGGNAYFNGMFDLVRVYNRALSTAEITSLYSNKYRPPTDGLVLWYSFDEGEGTLVNDLSGCGNDGTTVGSPVWVGRTLQNFIKKKIEDTKAAIDLTKTAVDYTKASVDLVKSSTDLIQSKVDAVTAELQSPTSIAKEVTLGLVKSATDNVKTSVDTLKAMLEDGYQTTPDVFKSEDATEVNDTSPYWTEKKSVTIYNLTSNTPLQNVFASYKCSDPSAPGQIKITAQTDTQAETTIEEYPETSSTSYVYRASVNAPSSVVTGNWVKIRIYTKRNLGEAYPIYNKECKIYIKNRGLIEYE